MYPPSYIPLCLTVFCYGVSFSSGPNMRDMIIIITVVCLAVIVLVIVVVVMRMRMCQNVKREPQSAVLTQPHNMDSIGRADTFGRIITTAPPPYASYPQYGTSHDTDRYLGYLYSSQSNPNYILLHAQYYLIGLSATR